MLVLLGLLVPGWFAIAGDRQPAGHSRHSDNQSAANGKMLFERRWTVSGGLGPLYNARSCVACHIDHGRGQPPEIGSSDPSFLLRLSVPPSNEAERMALALDRKSFIGEPRYGGQLQHNAIAGHQAEGRVVVAYFGKPYRLDDGTVVVLRRPVYSITNPSRGPLGKDVLKSPRIAQPLKCVGQTDAVSDKEILANEDPGDRDGDGISGRANRVRDIASGKMVVGRFGWKASQPNLVQQTAAAFAQDIGISSKLFLEAGGSGGGREVDEISRQELSDVAEYLRRQSCPVERIDDKGAQKGRLLFERTGCIACHRRSLSALTGIGSGRRIIPVYSDLLLHDMGAGLADHRPVANASGWEWRTQPLWGLGQEGKEGDMNLLHDGRARTITEAILWHGGEARGARAKFTALSKTDRQKLVGFLRGL